MRLRALRRKHRILGDAGVTAVEYGIILGVVGIAGVAGIAALRGSFDTAYDQTSDAQGLVACQGVDPNCDAIPELDPAQLPGAVPGTVQVTVLPATSLAATSAVLNGSVTPGGNTVTIDFCYQTGADVASCTWVAATPSSASGGVPVDATLPVTGLTAGATYNVWLRAMNGTTPTVSGPESFTTVNSLPMLVRALDASAITTTTATLNGSVTANGSASNIQFCYQTGASSSGCTWVTATTSTASGSSATPVDLPVTGLSQATTYNVWVRATRDGVTVTSLPTPFTTSADPGPAVTLGTTTNITYSSAKVNGTATANGPSTTVEFCVQTSNSMSACTWVSAVPSAVTGSSATPVTLTVSGLSDNKKYYVWLRATRPGFAPFASGSFTTSKEPSVKLDNTSDIKENSAVLNGSVDAEGMTLSVEFCWQKSNAMSSCSWSAATPSTASGTGTTTVRKSVSGLDKKTKYYVWIRASASGVTLTDNGSFTTKDD